MIDSIQNLLPQKFPFVMVDTLYSYTETSLISGFTVKKENIFVQEGLFLESGVIEHMAQSVALHTGYQFYLKGERAPTGYIGAIKDLEIRMLPTWNDEIQTTVIIIQEFGGITLVDVTTRLHDIEIAKGQIKTVLAT